MNKKWIVLLALGWLFSLGFAAEVTPEETEAVENSPVPEVCLHENHSYFPDYARKEYVREDQNWHIMTGYAQMQYTCMDCGHEWQGDTAAEPTVIREEHSYHRGWCSKCMTLNECAHAHMVVNEFITNPKYSEMADDGHTMSGKIFTSSYCEDCGESWRIETSDGNVGSVRVPHEYEGGVCKDCKYKNPCAHPNADSWPVQMDLWYRLVDETGHTAVFNSATAYSCDDCGDIWETEPEKKATHVREEHSFANGVCEQCGYVDAQAEPEKPVPVKKLSLNKEALVLDLRENDTATLKATISPRNATNQELIWESSDESVAIVVHGVVSPVGEGRAKITCREAGGKKDSCNVVVIGKIDPRKAARITAQPKAESVMRGTKVTYSIQAENVLGYQWQVSTNGKKWTNIEGAQTAAYSYVADASNANHSLRCAVTGGNGKKTFSKAVKTKLSYPMAEITLQPEDAAACYGDSVEFTVAATDARSYQWQSSANGTKWKNVKKGAGESFSVKLSRENLNLLYRCVVTGLNGKKLESGSARASLAHPDVQIIAQPEGVKAFYNDTITLTVEAENAAAYQWQVNTGKKWKDVEGATETSYTFEASVKNAKYKYRCVVTGLNKGKENTNAVKMNLSGRPAEITKQPEGATVNYGDSVTFSVEAENARSYQWYYSKNGAKWSKLAKATKAETTVKVTKANIGYEYRCNVVGMDGKTVQTVPAGFALAHPDVKILRQPAGVKAFYDDSITLTVEAENAAAYQWQVNTGKKWADINGATETSYTFEATTKHAKYKYRCVITGLNNGKAASDAVKLSLSGRPAEITKQPSSVSAEIGDSVTFSVEAENAKSYQWYYSKNGAKWSKLAKATKAEATVRLTKANAGYQYCCYVVGMDGKTVKSNAVGFVLNPATE